MNPLLCKHEFDFSTQLMSSPPQVKCKLCGTRAFIDEAMEYENRYYTSAIPEDEKREYWKAVTIAFIGTRQTTVDTTSSISMSATGVANKMLENFVKKFK